SPPVSFFYNRMQRHEFIAHAQTRGTHIHSRSDAMSNTVPASRTFSQKLDLLAEVAVHVGLGLQSGQELVMTASLDSVPLARRITEHAYRAGASLVTTLYTDETAALARYRFAPSESFDRAANWLYDGMAAAFSSGAARLAITGA